MSDKKKRKEYKKKQKQHLNKFDIRIFLVIIIITVISVFIIFQSLQIIIGLVRGSKKLIEDWINRDISYIMKDYLEEEEC